MKGMTPEEYGRLADESFRKEVDHYNKDIDEGLDNYCDPCNLDFDLEDAHVNVAGDTCCPKCKRPVED